MGIGDSADVAVPENRVSTVDSVCEQCVCELGSSVWVVWLYEQCVCGHRASPWAVELVKAEEVTCSLLHISGTSGGSGGATSALEHLNTFYPEHTFEMVVDQLEVEHRGGALGTTRTHIWKISFCI